MQLQFWQHVEIRRSRGGQLIGVASYGELGHVAPRLPTTNFFGLLRKFGAARNFWQLTLSGSLSKTGVLSRLATTTSCSDKTPVSTRAHQEMRYPNVTWRIILYDYLFTTELRHTSTSGIFSKSCVHLTYLMDVGLRNASCVSCYYPLSVFLA